MLNNLLNKRFIVVFAVPFILGLLTVFSFQPFNLTGINFLIIPSLFLLLSYIRKKSKSIYRKKPFLSNLFFVGFLFGFGFFLSGIYWISYSLTFDDSFKYLIPFSIILVPLFLGLFFGVATLISGYFLQNNFSSILFFISSLSFLDYLRSKILTGFPWNLWAYSWSWLPEVLQILNPIGLFALNLLSLTFFCTPLLILFFKKTIHRLSVFIIMTSLFFLNFIYGSYTISENKERFDVLEVSKENSINLKIVSPNFDLKYNLSEEEILRNLKKLIRYSDPEKGKETIFVWPEGVFSGYSLIEVKNYLNLFKQHFSENHIIIFGINTLGKNGETFNSLLALNNKFETIFRYNKQKLVPFGEFLPLEKILNNFGLKKITQGHGSFQRGTTQESFLIRNFEILPLICYEIIFTELVQKSSKNKNIIVNISEDAWFGGSIGPHQHFAKAIFRAIESNTYVARAANQGISAFINNKGEVIKKLTLNETGNLELIIPIFDHDIRNKNDLIFFVLLFTYTIIFLTIRNKL